MMPSASLQDQAFGLGTQNLFRSQSRACKAGVLWPREYMATYSWEVPLGMFASFQPFVPIEMEAAHTKLLRQYH